MEKKLVIRIPRKDDSRLDEPLTTAMTVIDGFVDEWKSIIGEIEHGAAGITATIHAGRVVKIDLTRQIKLENQPRLTTACPDDIV